MDPKDLHIPEIPLGDTEDITAILDELKDKVSGLLRILGSEY